MAKTNTPIAMLGAIRDWCIEKFFPNSSVNISNPSNGQVLKYNSTSQKWENANESGGGGATSLNDLSDVTISNPDQNELLMYVQSLGWRNSVLSLQGLADVDKSASPQNNQMLKYDATNHKWIFVNGGSGGASDLSDLDDVVISLESDKQVLRYNQITDKWENETENIDDLGDVQLSSPSNGQVLKYDSATQKWKNANESGGGGGGATSLDDLSDVSINNLDSVEMLVTDNVWIEGEGWVPIFKNVHSPIKNGYYNNQLSASDTTADEDWDVSTWTIGGLLPNRMKFLSLMNSHIVIDNLTAPSGSGYNNYDMYIPMSGVIDFSNYFPDTNHVLHDLKLTIYMKYFQIFDETVGDYVMKSHFIVKKSKPINLYYYGFEYRLSFIN